VTGAPDTIELSVVVPCRNAADRLPELLGVLAGERPGVPWELVVVDNGSSDGTLAVAEGWSDALPVRVVDAGDRRGAWYARNVGAAAARGDHLLFLDSDDLVVPGYLATMRAALDDADLVAARLDSRPLNEGWAASSRPEEVIDGLTDHFGYLPYAAACTLGVRRAVFEEVGGFAEMLFGEDVDFCWRAQLSGRSIRTVPGAEVHYRYRGTLWGMFRQAQGYGRGQPLLFRRYRALGMPGRSWRQTARDWRGILVQLAYARSRRELAAALFLLGVYAGRVEGSLRHRALYL
jgi:glycosyltransferase involved in cell wall biosynthesis